MAKDVPVNVVRLDDEDRGLLDALIAFEKLSRSDVMRRAIRAYAKQLGVTARKPKRAKRAKR